MKKSQDTPQAIKPSLSSSLTEQAAHMMKAVAHPIRIGILDLLEQSPELTVTEIYKALGCEQSLVSHHLSKMRDCGVVAYRRDGQSLYYYLQEPDLTSVLDCIRKQDANKTMPSVGKVHGLE